MSGHEMDEQVDSDGWPIIPQRRPLGKVFEVHLTDRTPESWKAVDDPDKLDLLSEEEVIDGIFWGFIPPVGLYQGDGKGFGYATLKVQSQNSQNEEDCEDYKEVVEDALKNQGGESAIRNLAQAIWIARQGYHGKVVAEAEVKLVKMAVSKYILSRIKQASTMKSLASVYELLHVSKEYHVSDAYPAAFQEAQAALARLEAEAHQLAESARPDHNEKYSNVIRELSIDIYGQDIKSIGERATKLMDEVWTTLEKHRKIALDCKTKLEALEKQSISSSKLSKLEETIAKLKKISTNELTTEIARMKTEKTAKIRTIAKLKTELKRLKNEAASVKKETEAETAEFVGSFLKTEYEAKMEKKMQTQKLEMEKEKKAALVQLREELSNDMQKECEKLNGNHMSEIESLKQQLQNVVGKYESQLDASEKARKKAIEDLEEMKRQERLAASQKKAMERLGVNEDVGQPPPATTERKTSLFNRFKGS
uniref:Uncharacterized protein n=1 Tax=Aplanochytrium stocchinoi TaxID=215587 RepID=A0A6S7ZHQ0_9STRA|mmetsp:Transcript_13111/g.16319  ORF Transcript_13111/g.16319 Transcript_13111/m.16319 type:complete len:480 (-) Transcript_13111:1319-2758(-)